MKSNNSLTDKVNFEIIRYANCWEDADILLKGLNPEKGKKILSIGSAGDNSFSLLTANPELVVAVDVNKTQLYLIELKSLCFKKLDYEETLRFLGFKISQARKHIFRSIKNELSEETRNYWEKNIMQIDNGVIYYGKFENYFRIFSKKILPWIHSRTTITELFREKSNTEQENFYNQKWNSLKWKFLFRIFFSRYVMGKFGRDKEFLKEVNLSVQEYIYRKAEKHLKSVSSQNNHILRFNLTGNFDKLLPHYMQKENFEKIKNNIGALMIYEGYAQDAIGKFGKFNCMNLSDIFEYMDKPLFAKTANELARGTEIGGKIGYWNLMVPRRISGIMPDKAEYQKDLSLALSEIDKGFFYNQFIVDKII